MSTSKHLSLAEILDILEDGDDDNVRDIFIEPPEVNILTDEDSDDENGDINTLSRNQLMASAELRNRRKCTPASNMDGGPPPPKKLKKAHIDWSSGGESEPSTLFPQVETDNIADNTMIHYFELFFDDEILDHIVAASSEYSQAKNFSDIDLSREELKVFIAILLVSGYNRLPGKHMYWNASDDLRNIAVYEAMRRDRFDKIMRSLHFQSNAHLDAKDKFSKLRPLISYIQKKCMANYTPSSAISHDEAMVEYFGKHGCKQAIRSKPIRFGYKIWCQNSPSGYLIAFDPYQGKQFEGNEDMEAQFGKCASTVLRLLDKYPLTKSRFPYHIYCDNLFTTFPLLNELKKRGYNCTGTVRANRLGDNNCLLNSKEFGKKIRGSIECATAKFCKRNFLVTRWRDNAVVTVMSTYLAADPEGSVKRWSKSELRYVYVSIPYSIQMYNKNMGGTDRMDQNINACRISIRGKKWWWPLFTCLLDLCVQNAWLLARSKTSLSQLEFRRELAMSYLLKYKNLPKGAGKRSKIPTGADMARFDKIAHFVQKPQGNKQRRCAGSNCKSRVRTECSKCNVGLCVECFLPYHTE